MLRIRIWKGQKAEILGIRKRTIGFNVNDSTAMLKELQIFIPRLSITFEIWS